METYICTAAQARNADHLAIEKYHIPSLVLMEHAAMEILNILRAQGLSSKNRIVILCGPGNNGGDGIALARLLLKEGIVASVWLPEENKMSHDEKVQWDILKQLDHQRLENVEDLQNADWIIDALFGNGLCRPITGFYKDLIEKVNASKARILSVDVPSGIDATTGKVLGCAIQADITVSIGSIKTGLLLNQGKTHGGRVYGADIGIPSKIQSQYQSGILINESLARHLLPKRDDHSHKGTFGKALMIGGSGSMHGAITIALQACYQSGIGTLTCMIPESIHEIIGQKIEFAMNLMAPETNGYFDPKSALILDEVKENYDILSLGNGMGRQESTKALVKSALCSSACVLLDADACWGLQEQKTLLERKAPVILTPHLKEMTYLYDKEVSDILEDPFSVVSDFCRRYPSCTLVLKSDVTLIGHQQALFVLNQPNSRLAKGGSGDILCGIITGLYGQNRNALEAGALGVYIHAQCANIEKDPASILPQDLIQQIPDVFKSLRTNH